MYILDYNSKLTLNSGLLGSVLYPVSAVIIVSCSKLFIQLQSCHLKQPKNRCTRKICRYIYDQ